MYTIRMTKTFRRDTEHLKGDWLMHWGQNDTELTLFLQAPAHTPICFDMLCCDVCNSLIVSSPPPTANRRGNFPFCFHLSPRRRTRRGGACFVSNS